MQESPVECLAAARQKRSRLPPGGPPFSETLNQPRLYYMIKTLSTLSLRRAALACALTAGLATVAAPAAMAQASASGGALSDMDRDFQRRQREFREDLNQRRNEELTGVLDKANRAIKAIAEREKFDLILQDAVYVSPRLDITDTVIKQLNSGR